MAIAKDKKLHLIAGIIISAAFSIPFFFICKGIFPTAKFFANGVGSGFAGAILACIAGILKEVRDMTGKGTPEAADFWFTFLGGLIGSIPVMFMR